jgi:PAS domain S-box-containing protein
MEVHVAGITKDNSSRVTSVVGSMSDVSERKGMEISLRSSNEQFRSAFENSPIGHVIFGIDGQWRRVNKALCDALGYSKEELTSRPADKITHPESIGRASEQFAKLAAGDIDTYSEDRRYMTLLRNSADERISPFPRRIYPTAFVTGMPRAVYPFRIATRT